jgi:dihydrofolate synthase/folylpolyglutamate synthase
MGKTSAASGRPSPVAPTSARKPVAVRTARKGPRLESFSAAHRYLLDRVDVERISPSRLEADTLKLDRMFALMGLLDNPQRAIRTVHIAGTKGKGSTCEMTAACLEACGYTVGIYTSPHLLDIRERIRINREPIGAEAFVQVAQRVADAAANLEETDGEPTFFELMTAMAFVHFADEAVDVGVIEVGLGGRLDSTNIITPEVAAVTSISLDHMHILGNTIEKIAREKAGIFKRGVPAVTIKQADSVLEVLRAYAAEVEAPFQVVGTDIDISIRFEAAGSLGPHHRVSLSSPRNEFDHLAVPLRGEHQAWNCVLALAILDKLCERGFKTPPSKVTQGLATVQMPGRLETVSTSPRIVLDGAHNGESIKCMMKAIAAHVPGESMVVVFGCAADKDIDGMLKEVGAAADKVIFTRVPGNTRAADPKDLARKLAESGKMSQVADDVAHALTLAKKAVGREDLICVTGSLYLVAEAKKLLTAGKKSV